MVHLPAEPKQLLLHLDPLGRGPLPLPQNELEHVWSGRHPDPELAHTQGKFSVAPLE